MSSSKKINTFSIFVLLIFIVSLLYAGISLSHTASTREITIPGKAVDIAGRLETLTKTNTLYSPAYMQGITDIISSDPSISAFILYQDNEPSYVWPVGSSFIISNDAGKPELSCDSFLIQVNNGYFITDKGITNYSIAFSKITTDEIFTCLSHAFIAIISATLITFMVILYISLFCTPKQPSAKGCHKTNPEEMSEESFYVSKSDEDDYESDYPYQVAFNDDVSTVLDEQDQEDVICKPVIKDEIPDEFVVAPAQHQAAVHASPKKRVLKESEDPLGLFSDLTGFGWESYLETRLDSELIRAASSEYDLALFLIKIKDVERTDPAYSEICGAILSFFKFRDMVFEYGSDSFAGIVTGMDINGCMSSVEQLYTSLSVILQKNNIERKISIGISTRCLRIIPGDRLLHEAKDAISKADEEPDMPIVAFKVNPGKYKEYLEEELESAQEQIAS